MENTQPGITPTTGSRYLCHPFTQIPGYELVQVMIQPLRKDPEAFTRKMINLSFIGNGEYTSAGKAMSGKRQEKHYRKRECFVNL